MNRIVCECGNKEFIESGGYTLCPKCLNQMKQTEIVEIWMRRFNLKTQGYGKNWEHLVEGRV